MKLKYLAIAAMVIGITACQSNQGKAEDVIEDFIQNNMITPDEVSNLSFSKLDSTIHVSDSALYALRTTVDKTLYKKDIKYPTTVNIKRPLYYKRATFNMGNKKITQTFYLTNSIDNVIAVK